MKAKEGAAGQGVKGARVKRTRQPRRANEGGSAQKPKRGGAPLIGEEGDFFLTLAKWGFVHPHTRTCDTAAGPHAAEGEKPATVSTVSALVFLSSVMRLASAFADKGPAVMIPSRGSVQSLKAAVRESRGGPGLLLTMRRWRPKSLICRLCPRDP